MELSEKLFLTAVIFLNLMVDKDIFFEKSQKKCTKFCHKHKDLVKFGIGYAMFYSYTRDHSVSLIGTFMLILLENF